MTFDKVRDDAMSWEKRQGLGQKRKVSCLFLHSTPNMGNHNPVPATFDSQLPKTKS